MSPPPTFAVIGDVHAHMDNLRRVLDRIQQTPVDAVLMVGDLACAGHRDRTMASLRRYREQVAAVLDAVRAAVPDRPVCYVPGNHDLQALRLPTNVDGVVWEGPGGLRITGLGGTNPPARGFPYEWTEDELRARPTLDADILISHCPPARTPLDFARGAGRHVGSEAVRERAEALRGVLVCGHIHESAGVVQLNDCLCMNAGGLGRPHGGPQVGFVRGLDELWHEDLDTGQIQHLRRAVPA